MKPENTLKPLVLSFGLAQAFTMKDSARSSTETKRLEASAIRQPVSRWLSSVLGFNTDFHMLHSHTGMENEEGVWPDHVCMKRAGKVVQYCRVL